MSKKCAKCNNPIKSTEVFCWRHKDGSSPSRNEERAKRSPVSSEFISALSSHGHEILERGFSRNSHESKLTQISARTSGRVLGVPNYVIGRVDRVMSDWGSSHDTRSVEGASRAMRDMARFRQGLIDEGMNPERMQWVVCRGVTINSPKGGSRVNRDHRHIAVAMINKKETIVVDPCLVAAAPVPEGRRGVDIGQFVPNDSSTPFMDTPWIGTLSNYENLGMLRWQSVEIRKHQGA